MSSSQLSSSLSSFFSTIDPQSLGFTSFGATELKNPLSLAFYKSWLEKGYFGEMEYLRAHLPQKENPKLLDARAECALVFTFNYLPHPFPAAERELRIAHYVGEKDYHLWLKEKLGAIAEKLRIQFPDEIFLPMVDSSPVLERDLAVRAGLGWFGKNTCLLSREHGSLSFIGEIITSLKIPSLNHSATSSSASGPAVAISADFCGTCTRCIDICPTGALEFPRLLNATKCISYLTIESQELPPEDLREKIGDWFFGCDLCQTVCPWNQKVFGKTLETAPRRQLAPPSANTNPRAQLVSELREFLTVSGKQLQKKYADSPLIRARPFGLRRNAILVATNQGLTELLPEITALADDPRLASLVRWSTQTLSG
jgi:epoxyqueuosine reductase